MDVSIECCPDKFCTSVQNKQACAMQVSAEEVGAQESSLRTAAQNEEEETNRYVQYVDCRIVLQVFQLNGTRRSGRLILQSPCICIVKVYSRNAPVTPSTPCSNNIRIFKIVSLRASSAISASIADAREPLALTDSTFLLNICRYVDCNKSLSQIMGFLDHLVSTDVLDAAGGMYTLHKSGESS